MLFRIFITCSVSIIFKKFIILFQFSQLIKKSNCFVHFKYIIIKPSKRRLIFFSRWKNFKKINKIKKLRWNLKFFFNSTTYQGSLWPEKEHKKFFLDVKWLTKKSSRPHAFLISHTKNIQAYLPLYFINFIWELISHTHHKFSRFRAQSHESTQQAQAPH